MLPLVSTSPCIFRITTTRLPPPRINTVPPGQVEVAIHKTVDIDVGSDVSMTEADLTRGEREAKQMQFAV